MIIYFTKGHMMSMYSLVRTRILQVITYSLILGLGVTSPFLSFQLAILIVVAVSTLFTTYWLQGRFMSFIEIWIVPMLFYSGFILGSVVKFVLYLSSG